MRGLWQVAIAGSLAAVTIAGCADSASIFPNATALGATSSRKAGDVMAAPQTTGQAAEQDVYVLVPRQPGDPLESIRSAPVKSSNNSGGLVGNNDAAGAPMTGGDSAFASPSPAPSQSPASASPPSACEETATAGLFATSDRPVLATSKGVYVRDADSWVRIAGKFPCGTVPAAIAPAGTAWYAAAGDGIYRADAQSQEWIRVVSGTDVIDLDITPDAAAGVAVQEDGRPFLFSGSAWSAQTYKLAPMMGGVRILSATESYAVGQGVLGSYNGQTWTPLAQPDAANPVAGLCVRRASGSAVSLIATTRAGLYRRTGTGWVAELGPDPALYLGIPAFSGARGFASDLGAAGGAAYTYSAATWQAAPAPPAPIETSAVLPDGDVLALSTDGESLHLLSAGAWNPVAMP